MKTILKKINFKKMSGLAPAIIQDISTNRVLMLGFMNEDAFRKTIHTQKVWFYSRTKKCLWMKGEESKNYLFVKDIKIDCDADTILVKVKPAGPTCHLLTESCFDIPQPKGINKKSQPDIGFIAELFSVIQDRKKNMPKKSYTTYLFSKGLPKIEEKIMEEAEEVCRAVREETKKRTAEESVDVLYHLFTLLVQKGIKLENVLKEIKKRRK
ncbi:MAG: bifunctional phosphoribosyl-AMP cyclohydrolase/phosphoribosyl-ATP diphosphatase HisIE [Candidatus Magasanikbacteria bacterium]